MREIKFRAWDSTRNLMGRVIDVGDRLDREIWQGDDITLMQFTGLKDKNGKEIYEGDVVRGNPLGANNIETGIVQWMNDGWFVSDETERDNEKRLHYDFFGSVEIIGNIYENPELLK